MATVTAGLNDVPLLYSNQILFFADVMPNLQ
jgi:hypothetical protein